MNLNDSDPSFDLAMRSEGTEPESLFPVTFLQDIESDDKLFAPTFLDYSIKNLYLQGSQG